MKIKLRMSKSISFCFVVGMLLYVSYPASAFPGVPYSGSAESQGIDLNLDVVAASLPSTATVEVGYSKSTLAGEMSMPVTTGGEAFSAQIAVGTGSFLGLDGSVHPVTSTKTLGDSRSNPHVGSASGSVSLGLLGTLHVGATAASTQSSSELRPDDVSPTTEGTAAQSLLTGADVSLVASLISAQAITSTAAADTDAVGPNHDVFTSASAALSGVTLDLSALNLGLTQVITAAVITGTTAVVNDGVSGGESATANFGFVNLFVAGIDRTLEPPGTMITLTNGLASGRVTIAPVLTAVSQPLTSTAQVVALRIEMLTNALGMTNNTVIDLGAAHSVGSARPGNTGPTVVQLHRFEAYDVGPAYPVLLTVIVLSVLTRFAWRRAASWR